MNKYRSHTCNELRKNNVGKKVIISGWINKKRDHGNLLFIDLRDNYGITQCIIDKAKKGFKELEKLQSFEKKENTGDESFSSGLEKFKVDITKEN